MIQKNLISPFFRGFWAPLRGLKLLLRSPQTLAWAAIPLLINIALYVAFFIYGSEWLNAAVAAWIQKIAQSIPAWMPLWTITFTHWFLKILSWLALGLVAAFSFTFISTLVCAPFNDALSRSAIKAYRKENAIPFSNEEISLRVVQTLKLEVGRTFVLVIGGIFALIIGIIPFLQIPALVLGALLLSFEYFGYPLSQKTAKLVPVATYTLRRPLVATGFGSFLLLMMAMPFTSVFYIPLAVVGATLLYCEGGGSN